MSRELKEVFEEDRKLKNILEFNNNLRQEVTFYPHIPSHSYSSSTPPFKPSPPPPNLNDPPMAFARTQTLKELVVPTLDQ